MRSFYGFMLCRESNFGKIPNWCVFLSLWLQSNKAFLALTLRVSTTTNCFIPPLLEPQKSFLENFPPFYYPVVEPKHDLRSPVGSQSALRAGQSQGCLSLCRQSHNWASSLCASFPVPMTSWEETDKLKKTVYRCSYHKAYTELILFF